MRNQQHVPIRAGVLFAVAAIACVFPAMASRVRRLSLDQVREQAQTIVVVDVLNQSTRVGDGARMVWTDYQLRVNETLKGSDAGALMTVSFAGGQAGGLDIGLSDVPSLTVGKRYVLFLQSGVLHPTPTVGWGQGLFRVERVGQGSTSRTVIVSDDGEPLEIDAAGRLTRGPRVVIRGGAMTSATSVEPNSAVRKMAEPTALNADGSPAPLVRRVEPAKAAPQHTFATMSQLRKFAAGKLEAARPKSRLQ